MWPQAIAAILANSSKVSKQMGHMGKELMTAAKMAAEHVVLSKNASKPLVILSFKMRRRRFNSIQNVGFIRFGCYRVDDGQRSLKRSLEKQAETANLENFKRYFQNH